MPRPKPTPGECIPNFASTTKIALNPAEIQSLVRAAFGARTEVVAAREADNGMYNAVYMLSLEKAERSAVVLKVAPPDRLPSLTYEHNLMRAEAEVLERLGRAGLGSAPALLHADFSRGLIDRDHLFMECLEGESLSKLTLPREVRVTIRREIGRIAGSISAITGRSFGYPAQPALQAREWPAAFALMWQALLDDAERFDILWPMPRSEIDAALARALRTLDDIDVPRLVHFDLWDGNIMIDEAGRITGVIDWERAFFGDPLAEIVSLHFFDDADEDRALFEGLSEGSRSSVTLDARVRRRLALYRAYLWMIMIVEAVPRGFGGSIRLPHSSAARRFRCDLAIAAASAV